MTPRRLGALAAVLTLALDQGTKLGLLFGTDLAVSGQPWPLAPFAELVAVWNRGVSYGLFQQHTEIGRWALVVLSLAASVGLAVWLRRAHSALLGLSLGLILGGALGNAVDRTVFGAVFDFVHLFAAGYSWYIFNVADAAIVAGVVGLLWDGLRGERHASRAPAADRPTG
jgi:signal peptidase II